jgi:hypothetical protein
MELKPIEKLAIAQAFQKRIGDMVSTKDPYNLRGQVDGEIRKMYEQTGAKSFDVRILGEKVGSYSVTVSKPKPQTRRVEIAVLDPQEFREWCEANGFTKVDYDAVNEYVKDTGDVPEGCRLDTVIEPEIVGGQVSRTTLKVDPAKVAEVMQARLGEVAANLLEGETI